MIQYERPTGIEAGRRFYGCLEHGHEYAGFSSQVLGPWVVIPRIDQESWAAVAAEALAGPAETAAERTYNLLMKRRGFPEDWPKAKARVQKSWVYACRTWRTLY